MNRRSFLQSVGVGAAAVVVAPKVFTSAVPSASDTNCTCNAWKPLIGTAEEWCPVHGVKQCQEPITKSIEEYGSYASFSTFALAAAIDANVSRAASELAHRAGLSMSSPYANAWT